MAVTEGQVRELDRKLKQQFKKRSLYFCIFRVRQRQSEPSSDAVKQPGSEPPIGTHCLPHPIWLVQFIRFKNVHCISFLKCWITFPTAL